MNQRRFESEVQEYRPQKKVKLDESPSLVTPWASSRTLAIKSPQLRFHNEIVEFYNFISPQPLEHQRREEAFNKVKTFLAEYVPNAKVEAFGSFVTKLYLPNSDMDIVCIDESNAQKTLYSKVAKALYSAKEHFEQVNLITNAKVPIIKFLESESQLNFDLSFNKVDGLKQIPEVMKAFEVYPEAKYLIYVMKCLLRQRDLHETYSGGIGSFLLFCMVISFLREFRKDFVKKGERANLNEVLLSEYLLNMMDFYGSRFDFQRKRIIMTNGGYIIDKPNIDDRLSLISPQDPDHDIGHSAYKIRDIFQVLKNRYNFLMHYNYQPNESVLKYLLNPCSQTFSLMK